MCVVISIAADKGGVGKTMLSFILSQNFANDHLFGQPVLAIDCDPQGNLTETALGVPGEELELTWPDAVRQSAPLPLLQTEVGIDVLPTDMSEALLPEDMGRNFADILADVVEPLKAHYGIIVLDCPPGASNEFTVAALRCSDYAIVPVLCDGYWSSTLSKMTKLIENPDTGSVKMLGIVINLFKKKVALNRFYEMKIREAYGDLVLRPTIRQSSKISEVSSLGIAVRRGDNPKATEIEVDLSDLTLIILRRIEESLDFDMINERSNQIWNNGKGKQI